tara:strand:+ start:8169 stop:9542 length:1374 start_codon:yes stop_codon:yes gene_type:complete
MANIGDQFPLGRNGYYYVLGPEDPSNIGTFGTQILPANNDAEDSSGTFTRNHAVAPLSINMGFDQDRNFTDTAQGTRARIKDNIITGKLSVSWDIETYLNVSDGSLKGPDIHRLLKAAIGASSTTDSGAPPRDKKFLPATTGNALDSLNIVRVIPDSYSETIYGAVIETMTISMASGDPVTVKFSGKAFNHILGGVATASSEDYRSITTSTEILCDPPFDIYNLQPKTDDYAKTANGAASLWAWKTNENTTGYSYDEFSKVDVYSDEDAGKFKNSVIENGPNEGSELRMVPFYPDGGATFGTPLPISSTQGTITITPYKSDDTATHTAITTAPITSLEINLSNTIKAVDDQAFTESSLAGFIPGARDVTGTVNMRVKSSIAALLYYRRELFRRCAVEIKLGDTSGNHVQIDMAYVEFDPSSIDVSGQDELTVSIPFKSMVKDATAAEVVKDFIIEWK